MNCKKRYDFESECVERSMNELQNSNHKIAQLHKTMSLNFGNLAKLIFDLSVTNGSLIISI